MINGQLELSFENMCNCSSRTIRRPAPNTRKWWFERMREIVDRARDWQPAAPPRPEQTAFTQMYRQPMVASQEFPAAPGPRDEQQVCE
jgi:hypothetical protein